MWALHLAILALSSEVGGPLPVHEDLGPVLRGCENGDPKACVHGADLAHLYGHPSLENNLRLRACRAEHFESCPDDATRCGVGDAEACRRNDASNDPDVVSTAGRALTQRCQKGDKAACTYLDEAGLSSVQLVPVVWGTVFEGSSRPVVGSVFPSPNGKRALWRRKSGGLWYLENGEVTDTIELPAGYSVDARPPYLWTKDTLWFPLEYKRNSRHDLGFYLDGRYIPLPESWRVPLEPKERCRRIQRVGRVAYKQCFPGDKDYGVPTRVFRSSLDGRPYRTLQLPPGGKIVGAGREPGSVWVQSYEAPLRCIGPNEEAPRSDGRGTDRMTGQVLEDQGHELTVLAPANVRVLDLETHELRWLDAETGDTTGPQIVAATSTAWIRQREVDLGKAHKQVQMQLITRSGFRSRWFRADLLGRLSLRRVEVLAGGFFFRDRRGGVYLRPPNASPHPRGLAPTGRITAPLPVRDASWPSTRFGAEVTWRRRPSEKQYLSDHDGWPAVGPQPQVGLGLAPPDSGEIRPTSRHLLDHPGLEKTLNRCARGVYEACQEARSAARHGTMPKGLISQLRRLRCDDYVPSRCESPPPPRWGGPKSPFPRDRRFPSLALPRTLEPSPTSEDPVEMRSTVVRLEFVAPGGKKPKRVRIRGRNLDIGGGPVLTATLTHPTEQTSKRVVMTDAEGHLSFEELRLDARPQTIYLAPPDHLHFATYPVAGAPPEQDLLTRDDVPCPRNAQGHVVVPRNQIQAIFYDVAPGWRMRAVLEGGVFKADGAFVQLVPPHREATILTGRYMNSDSPGQIMLSTPEDPFTVAVRAGRWRFEVRKEPFGELWWSEVVVEPRAKHRVELTARSRQVELTIEDRMGWPAGEDGTNVAGQDLLQWLPVTTVRLLLRNQEPELVIPPGKGVYRARVIMDDPPYRR